MFVAANTACVIGVTCYLNAFSSVKKGRQNRSPAYGRRYFTKENARPFFAKENANWVERVESGNHTLPGAGRGRGLR